MDLEELPLQQESAAKFIKKKQPSKKVKTKTDKDSKDKKECAEGAVKSLEESLEETAEEPVKKLKKEKKFSKEFIFIYTFLKFNLYLTRQVS